MKAAAVAAPVPGRREACRRMSSCCRSVDRGSRLRWRLRRWRSLRRGRLRCKGMSRAAAAEVRRRSADRRLHAGRTCLCCSASAWPRGRGLLSIPVVARCSPRPIDPKPRMRRRSLLRFQASNSATLSHASALTASGRDIIIRPPVNVFRKSSLSSRSRLFGRRERGDDALVLTSEL